MYMTFLTLLFHVVIMYVPINIVPYYQRTPRCMINVFLAINQLVYLFYAVFHAAQHSAYSSMNTINVGAEL